MFEEFGINAGFVEDLHAQYLQSPGAVPESWRIFFQERNSGTPNANGNGNGTYAPAAHVDAPPSRPRANGARETSSGRDEKMLAMAALQGRVIQLINAYRMRGHLYANLDPLRAPSPPSAELDLESFGLTDDDLDTTFPATGVAGLPEKATLRQIVDHLTATYCGSIGVEYMNIDIAEERTWLQSAMERTMNRAKLGGDEVERVVARLCDAELFEQFVDKNFKGAKRFSCEGSESMIAMLDLLVDNAAGHGVEEIVIGMAHRGRLNVLANIMDKPVHEIFAVFRDSKPERFVGRGDVKYHLGYSSDRVTFAGAKIHLSLCFNPSHLEFVNPVVEGRVRAKQERKKRGCVMPLLIHGDAAFMGQGIVPETLNLAGLEGYSTQGTIHLVVNNQIGFTTLPEDSRSTRYCTDITRMMDVPVFHVNGEDPEAVIQVARLALEYRQRFARDVVIDMYGYRKYGHNEGDEPRFTQPSMYKLIDQKPTVREMYMRNLIAAGRMTEEKANEIVTGRRARLEAALEEEKRGDYMQPPNAMQGLWTAYVGGPYLSDHETPTGVPKETLIKAIEALSTVPEGFHVNAKVKSTVLDRRKKNVTSGEGFDWGTAEHLAYATLLLEGSPIRLSGQDARRGTFSHRHSVLYDSETGARHCPLAELGGARFQVWDSPLSEGGVLGFEYGYSLDFPESLVIWEAQFGDFLNGGQVIVDQFIVSAEDKWNRLSGLVLLLPHGYEGQGPEHSSARIERFMSMAAQDNIQVCNLSTPAQFFHVLRRQVRRRWRKPLVVFTPKSLLRHPEAVSTIGDLSDGAFQPVISDTTVDPKKVKRVLLCSGKVYYDLAANRKKNAREDVAIVRIEQLYPLTDALPKALAQYPEGTPLVWVQEEPANMGAWYYLSANAQEVFGKRPLSIVSRPADASPATGSKASHDLEQSRLIDEAFAR